MVGCIEHLAQPSGWRASQVGLSMDCYRDVPRPQPYVFSPCRDSL